ncbi:hypothetical protein [Microbispora sp. ATCC PTA-5024]|uniref:hypothetical protein n=1 Tax=Microbispora sp. ATCC PTA-5024 TaxID=316330 RepID=UPI0012EDE539|nr:hypothetical protein [Microbispora sp. ATCC PTA-5024]
MRVEQCASVRITGRGLTPAQISDTLGISPSRTSSAGAWVLEPPRGDSGTSLEEQINAVVGPLLGVVGELAELVRGGAVVELFLSRSLLGPGAGMLCFMIDGSVIRFLAEVGASVWFDEYDEYTGEEAGTRLV